MKTLSPSEFQQSVSFLRKEARPLESVFFAYYFEDGPAESVLKELARFQNTDGGFGHGLEPDVRLADSSVIATTIAFQHLRELRVPAEHPLVVNGCRYLRETYDTARLNWPIIPPTIDDAPHAPWWIHNGELMNRQINPRVEILGYIYDYAVHFPEAMRHSLTASVMDHVQNHPDEMEMHDLLCCLRLYETESLPEAVKTSLLQKLTLLVAHNVARSQEQWRAYGLPPLAVIKSPQSPFASLFVEEIPQNLDFLIEARGAEGAWRPNWSWGDLWPEAWQQAERDWSGVITLDNLRTLHSFGRVSQIN